MIDPFTRTRFDSAYQLETWYPVGRLDATMAMSMAKHIGFEESIADEPFNRYGDLSLLTGIHLDFIEVAVFAAERRAAYYERGTREVRHPRDQQGGLRRRPHVRGADGAVSDRRADFPHGRGRGGVARRAARRASGRVLIRRDFNSESKCCINHPMT